MTNANAYASQSTAKAPNANGATPTAQHPANAGKMPITHGPRPNALTLTGPTPITHG